MSMFSTFSKDGLEDSKDVLGGNFDPVTTDVYDATIKVVYIGNSARSKAQSATVIATLEGGKEFRETIWFTSAKGVNYYADKKDASKRQPLPGFTTIDDLCLLATGHELSEQDTENKVLKIYSAAVKEEVPTEVPTISDLAGKQVKFAIQRQIVDKTKANDAGEYVPTGETRMENTIAKVLHAETGRTVPEYRHEVDPAQFMPAWIERNRGKDRNRSVGKKDNAGGIGSSGTGRPEAKKSLFG